MTCCIQRHSSTHLDNDLLDNSRSQSTSLNLFLRLKMVSYKRKGRSNLRACTCKVVLLTALSLLTFGDNSQKSCLYQFATFHGFPTNLRILTLQSNQLRLLCIMVSIVKSFFVHSRWQTTEVLAVVL